MSLVQPTHDPEIYRERRQRLARWMNDHGGGLALIPTGAPKSRNAASSYPFRFDSQFYYLTGFTEPDAWLAVIARPGHETESWLFCQEKNPDSEIWDGVRWGPAAARETFGLDHAQSTSELTVWLTNHLIGHNTVFAPLHRCAVDNLPALLQSWIGDARQKARGLKPVPSRWFDLSTQISQQRLIKDAAELDLMRQSAKIAASAHCQAMRSVLPGMTERAVEAELLSVFLKQGAQAAAYETIVATGANACTLHHAAGHSVIGENDLVLIDAGCELHGYASDITRTFPASGRFGAEQAALYDIVLAAQTAAAEQTRPGLSFNAGHEAAVRVLTQGLVDEGILKGSVQEAIETGAFKDFYMHRTGHWLGLDVHDAGPYCLTEQQAEEPDWLTLEAGMVLTIEPGLYIRPSDKVAEKFWNIGIRIEDDAIVTPTGCELITRGVPVKRDEIEALMRQGRTN